MQVIIVKDGTVPIAIAKVIATEGTDGADLPGYFEKLFEGRPEWADSGHDIVEAFEVKDGTQYLYVSWNEGQGFDVVDGFTDLNDALDYLNEGAEGEQIAASNQGGGHWSLTYFDNDEDESYGHVFTL